MKHERENNRDRKRNRINNEKNKISLEDLELKTGINKTLLKQFLELKKEPYLITEGGKILPAIGLKSEEEFDIFIKKWIELSKKKNC